MKNFFKILLVIVVLLFAAVLIFLNFAPKGKRIDNNQSSNNQISITGPAQLKVEQKAQPLFSYSGAIKEIGKDYLKIEASKERNPVLEKTIILTVKIDDKTQFTKISPPADLLNPPAGAGPSLLKRATINFSDLKIDQDITAISEDDISGASEFTADRIELMAKD